MALARSDLESRLRAGHRQILGSRVDRPQNLRLVVNNDEILAGRIRGRFTLYPIGTEGIENWARWARGRAGGPRLALAQIYTLGRSLDWGVHKDLGLPPEVIAAMKRSEPLTEVGRDPVEVADIDKRSAWLVDTMLHRSQTPVVWRGVAYSFVWTAPEYHLPAIARAFLTRGTQPTALSDDGFIAALDELLEFVELMLGQEG